MISYKNILVQTKYYIATWMHMCELRIVADTWAHVNYTVFFFIAIVVWAWYQIRDDFYFYSVICSKICHRNCSQIRAHMGYLQICDENSQIIIDSIYLW